MNKDMKRFVSTVIAIVIIISFFIGYVVGRNTSSYPDGYAAAVNKAVTMDVRKNRE